MTSSKVSGSLFAFGGGVMLIGSLEAVFSGSTVDFGILGKVAIALVGLCFFLYGLKMFRSNEMDS